MPATSCFGATSSSSSSPAWGYVTGVTQSREYAEPEWMADLWLTLVWVVYLIVFVGTIMKRREPHIYVANWFFLAFIVTVAMLHIVNNLAIPVDWTGAKSYSLFSGVQDALTQWWYAPQRGRLFPDRRFPGHHVLLRAQAGGAADLFLPPLHRPFLVADLPLYLGRAPSPALHVAARLGADAGHDVLDHAVDAVMGRHDQRHHDAVGRVGQTAHRPGPAHDGGVDRLLRHVDLRGPGDVDQGGQFLSHYTDWTIGHVHSGALGWVAYISFGALYYLFPKLWGRSRLYSIKLVNWHFWISTIGILLYIISMWISGIMQGLMWRTYDALGFLQYSFVETVEAMHPFYVVRALGGILFLIGGLIMAYNLWRTVRGDVRDEARLTRRRNPPRSRRNRGLERWLCSSNTIASNATSP